MLLIGEAGFFKSLNAILIFQCHLELCQSPKFLFRQWKISRKIFLGVLSYTAVSISSFLSLAFSDI